MWQAIVTDVMHRRAGSVRRLRAGLLLALCAGLVTGCAQQNLTNVASNAGTGANAGTGSSSGHGRGSGAAYPSALSGGSLSQSGSVKKTAFNPFEEDFTTEPPKRIQIIKNPTLAQVMKTGVLPERSMGRADAPVTIIKYASLTCPYCRKFQKEVFPILKRDYIDHGKVRYIIREFPIGHQSGLATIAWRCAGKDKFFKFYETFLFNQHRWVSQQVRPEPILKLASKLGMTRAKFDSCQKNQAMVAGLKWIKDRGRQLGVIGTPNFFINGKLVRRHIGIKELREIIDPLLSNKLAGANNSQRLR